MPEALRYPIQKILNKQKRKRLIFDRHDFWRFSKTRQSKTFDERRRK